MEQYLHKFLHPLSRKTIMHRSFALTAEIAAYLFAPSSALALQAADRTLISSAMMRRMKRKLFLIAALSFATGLAGCTALPPEGGSGQVSVEASFRERLALAPGVRLEASLLDVSRADAAAAVIGKTVHENVGSRPIALPSPTIRQPSWPITATPCAWC